TTHGIFMSAWCIAGPERLNLPFLLRRDYGNASQQALGAEFFRLQIEGQAGVEIGLGRFGVGWANEIEKSQSR
ncbi:hypothetical protein MOQ26_23725, partial [Stenotrophomonas maltophilia]|nr:hypothetical protein [Stenotrophomonas maltophilia]